MVNYQRNHFASSMQEIRHKTAYPLSRYINIAPSVAPFSVRIFHIFGLR